MAIINHDYKDINFLEHIITKNDGTPLYGEIDMYRRIYNDLDADSRTCHFWHDVSLPIPIKDQSSIQIDFLLVCEKGVVIIEVKGGHIGIENGIYYYQQGNHREFMKRSPFDQAEDYLNALRNNKVFDFSQIFLTTLCAFPHTYMKRTSDNIKMDQSWRLWSAFQQEDENKSFATYCFDVIEKDKQNKKIFRPDLSEAAIDNAIKNFTFNFSSEENKHYTNTSLESILKWLKVDSLRLLSSLRKNKRIVIEGGPGSGKTTLAKAYVKSFGDMRGLYICWNKLLESRIRWDLNKEELKQCEVAQFASLLMRIQYQIGGDCSLDDINKGHIDKIESLLIKYRQSDDFKPYNYIIIDEAQDILDKGAVKLLQYFSFLQNGLESGSYMVFYDTEQGFNSNNRQIEGFAQLISNHSAHFILDENKRVPTNKELVECAAAVMSKSVMVSEFLQENKELLNIEWCKGAKSILKRINEINNTKTYQKNIKDCVILAHSSTQKTDFGESLYDIIATATTISELNERNINNNPLDGIPFTSILRFKGLESKHVILVLNNRTYIDNYELYIGITRAIIDVTILILE